MLFLFFLIVIIPPLRALVDLAWLGISGYFILGIVALGWGIMVRTIWRRRLLDRFLGVSLR
jgi:cation-transporting ATPase E